MWNGGDIRVTVCPVRTARELGLQTLALAASGMESMSPVMPYSGGPMEQPAVLMDAISIWMEEKASLKQQQPPKQ